MVYTVATLASISLLAEKIKHMVEKWAVLIKSHTAVKEEGAVCGGGSHPHLHRICVNATSHLRSNTVRSFCTTHICACG